MLFFDRQTLRPRKCVLHFLGLFAKKTRKNGGFERGIVMLVEEVLRFNRAFVEKKAYTPYLTSKYPDKKLAILSCMDTRLIELLPAALGLHNGDAKIIKNAGGVISHPFGSVMRSLMIAIYDLDVKDILVIGHTDCGVQQVDVARMVERMLTRGVLPENIEMARYCGVDFDQWLAGFDCVENSVYETVEIVAKHPFIPKDVSVYGFVMDSDTGALTAVHSLNRGEESTD